MSELRLLATVRSDGTAVPLRDHVAHYGELPSDGSQQLVAELAAAGLTGRGGAAFPTAAKFDAVLAQRTRPVVVANGAEGEPASSKDKVLLSYVPHLVLDGAVLAARSVGARNAIVATTSATAQYVARAIAERRDPVRLRLVAAPDRFVAGEETALVRYLNGGPALPTFTPPRPFERGVGDAPTLMLNVETLAQIALIARYGATWFRREGTRAEPGTVLVTLGGAVASPGVYEIALGSPLAELVALAGGATAELSAFLVGGYFGSWIDAADGQTTRLANADLARLRASLGARAIHALPAAACGVAETARVTRYLAHESAGQCGPCVHGLDAVAGNLEHLARADARRGDAALLRRRLGQIAGRGACRHPDGAVGLVASALRVFAGDFERHASGRRCGATIAGLLPLPRKAAA
jgi:NADH:ubiquinone oxidoreductase subunit F (NADH-binding)